MRMLISFLLLLMFAFLSAYMAKQRGRDPVAWFMIGILIGIFAPILLLILRPLEPAQENEKDMKEDGDTYLSSRPQVAENSFTEKEWFYLDKNHEQQGPIYFSALKPLWQEKKIISTTYVWSSGMSEWKRIQELPGFMEAL